MIQEKNNHTEYNHDMNNEFYSVSAEKTKEIIGAWSLNFKLIIFGNAY